MKDFIKWLGVNEKIAKVVVWLMIIMTFLIIFNTAMESLGFPYYAITYDNLVKLKSNIIIEYISNWMILFLTFYCTVLLVFRVKEYKNIFKHALLYLILNILFTLVLPNAAMQLFIIIYIAIFCYLYSNKNWKYLIYGVLANMVIAFVLGIWYLFKARYINYAELNYFTKGILVIDYFIIMAVIILVKEIYLKKRGEKNARTRNKFSMVGRIQERKQTSKETSKKSSKHS